MWDLDYRKYEVVHLKNAQISPWIVNPEAIDGLKELASFISEIKMRMKTGYLNDVYGTLQELYHKKRESALDLDQVQSALGIVSYLLPSDSFLDHIDFNEHKSKTDCVLLTEKNLLPQLIGKGSSRHALGTNYQFKGIGRNPLAHAEDYYHSWGGYVSRDALRSLLCDKIISERTKLGCVRTDALFKYEESFIDKTPLVLAVREANCYRLSQIIPSFISESEKNILLSSLFERFKTKNLESILNQVIEHYVHAFSCGVVHRSISQENLTLDGRFIDTDSVEFSEEIGPCPLYIKLGFKVSNRDLLKPGTLLKDVLKSGDSVGFYKTWLHDLMLMSELTANAYECLSGKKYDWQKICQSYCEKYLAPEFIAWASFLKYESFSRKFYLSSQFPIEEIKLEKEELELCSASMCNGSFYDFHTHRLLNNFTLTEDSLRKTGMMTLLKYDLSFWNKPASWDNSFENWNLINPKNFS